MRTLSLACVGADHPNKGKSPGRRFEIALCVPGEPLELRPEPENPRDERAIAVYSCRGVQLGYIQAEKAALVGKLRREAERVKLDWRAVFQQAAPWGAIMRVSFDGSDPAIGMPAPSPLARPPQSDSTVDDDPGFWPDEEWLEE